MATPTPRGGEAGTTPIELLVGIGLLMVPAAIMAAMLPLWLERDSAGGVAAVEAARAVVLLDCEAGMPRATAVVAQTAQNHGLDTGALQLASAHGCEDGQLAREGAVVVSVSVHQPVLPMTPSAAFSYTRSHREPLDPHRSIE